jgi:hypothetical protein
VEVKAEYQQLSVALDRTAVDFGTVASYKQDARQVLRLTNNTGVELRVRSQVVMPRGLKSELLVELPASFTLQPYDSSVPFELRLRPSDCSEVIQGAKLLVAAGSAANTHEVAVSAQVLQPQYDLQLDKERLSANDLVRVPSLQPGQEHKLELQLYNKGANMISHCAAARVSWTHEHQLSCVQQPVVSMLQLQYADVEEFIKHLPVLPASCSVLPARLPAYCQCCTLYHMRRWRSSALPSGCWQIWAGGGHNSSASAQHAASQQQQHPARQLHAAMHHDRTGAA